MTTSSTSRVCEPTTLHCYITIDNSQCLLTLTRLPTQVRCALSATSSSGLTFPWPIDPALLHSISTWRVGSGLMQSPTLPPSVWTIIYSSTPPASAWGCAPSSPMAIAGHALMAAKRRVTALLKPLTATSSEISRKVAVRTLQRCCDNSFAVMDSPPATRHGTPRLHPAPFTAPRHTVTFIATSAWDLATCSRTSVSYTFLRSAVGMQAWLCLRQAAMMNKGSESTHNDQSG
jgi:hypothetical protein